MKCCQSINFINFPPKENSSPSIVIASGAKQSSGAEAGYQMDCRVAPLLAMTRGEGKAVLLRKQEPSGFVGATGPRPSPGNNKDAPAFRLRRPARHPPIGANLK
jgi:hypothetical protein